MDRTDEVSHIYTERRSWHGLKRFSKSIRSVCWLIYKYSPHDIIFSATPKTEAGQIPNFRRKGSKSSHNKTHNIKGSAHLLLCVFLTLKTFCLSPIFKALSNVDDLNLVWYNTFVIGYRLRSYRFVRGGETNEPYTRACSYYYSRCYSWNYLVFRLQMARW